jgi:2-polyprenyl-3-methyl-5-hydroxy-6-metoxy-1,4-benzoquinol methylase/ribosomal protein S27E
MMQNLPEKFFSEEDTRPAQLMADKQKYVDADRQFLLSQKKEWVEVKCPACDSVKGSVYGEKLGFIYVECNTCGTVYTNPRPSLSLMKEFYAKSQNYDYWNKYIFPATEQVRRDRIFRPRVKRLAEYCRNQGVSLHTLLEIGAGFGIFCEEMRKEKLFKRIIALEPTADLAQTCRLKGFEVMEMFIEEVQENEIADVIAAFEVIEHLFSPRNFMGRCARLLKPRGFLILSCPNVRGFDVLTLRTLSNTFDHEHVNYFHTQSLPVLIKRCGFNVLDMQTPGRLDAQLVRKQAIDEMLDLRDQPFLHEVLIERWEELGNSFQEFLSLNKLSSHMLVIAQKLKRVK